MSRHSRMDTEISPLRQTTKPFGSGGDDGSFSGARAAVVNRTHRVVRGQALEMRELRQKERSLWVPLGIVSVMLLVVCYAVWVVMDGYELMPNGVPDASDQLVILLLWSLPVTALVLGVGWYKRGRGRMGNGEV